MAANIRYPMFPFTQVYELILWAGLVTVDINVPQYFGTQEIASFVKNLYLDGSC